MDQRRAAILVSAALLLTACATPSPSPSPPPIASAASSPVGAVEFLECDDRSKIDGVADGVSPDDAGGSTPDEALFAWMASRPSSWVPNSGYERVATLSDGAVYGYHVDGEVKVAVLITSRLAGMVGAAYAFDEMQYCDLSEVFSVGPAHRVWINSQGQTLDDDIGPEHCQWQLARILNVPDGNGFRRYLRDPLGVMSRDQTLFDTYAAGISLPADAIDSGYRSGELELWFTPGDTAAYVVSPDGVERWPRYEVTAWCV
jgi:hypothetical protein